MHKEGIAKSRTKLLLASPQENVIKTASAASTSTETETAAARAQAAVARLGSARLDSVNRLPHQLQLSDARRPLARAVRESRGAQNNFESAYVSESKSQSEKSDKTPKDIFQIYFQSAL